MALATVVHAVDHFGGRLRDGVDAWDAIVATAAPVMVTGTPRRLALAAIADLEAGPRGWYGGLVVQVAANGDALVGTILRAAAIRDGVAEVRTGGDLLADSDPAREEHESRVKAVSLWRALGLRSPPICRRRSRAASGRCVGAATRPAHATPTPAPLRALPRAVALRDAGDPFGAAVTDALRASASRSTPPASRSSWIGGEPRCAAPIDRRSRRRRDRRRGVRASSGSGLHRSSIRPEHGRFVRCRPTAAAPARCASSVPRDALCDARRRRAPDGEHR